MRKIAVESVGIGALKLSEFLREQMAIGQMQLNNISFESVNTVCVVKEVIFFVLFFEVSYKLPPSIPCHLLLNR